VNNVIVLLQYCFSSGALFSWTWLYLRSSWFSYLWLLLWSTGDSRI